MWLFALTTGVVFGAGVYHLLQRDAVKFVLGFSLILGATNLFLLMCGAFDGDKAPYVDSGGAAVDPVPQALVLTAIVIGFGVLALLLALVLSIAQSKKTLDLDRLDQLKG